MGSSTPVVNLLGLWGLTHLEIVDKSGFAVGTVILQRTRVLMWGLSQTDGPCFDVGSAMLLLAGSSKGSVVSLCELFPLIRQRNGYELLFYGRR